MVFRYNVIIMFQAFGVCSPKRLHWSSVKGFVDFVEFNSSIPTELNVSNTKPDKTGTVS